MAPPFLIPLTRFDVNKVIIGIEEIEKVNPQRYEFAQLDGILLFEPSEGIIVGYKDIKPDAFWVRGHIPNRPLLPGVLMIESAAQLASFYYKNTLGKNDNRFVGFGGVDKVKFRQPVLPGEKFIILGKCLELRSRRIVFETQGVVNNKLVFEGIITGMVV